MPVLLNDVTLREGVQVAGRAIDAAAKAAIGMILAAAGVTQLQVGYPGRAELDRQAIALLKEAGCTALLEGMCSLGGDDWAQEIDTAAGSGADRLVLIFPTAEYRLTDILHITRRQCLDRIAAGVAHAAERGIPVAFAPVEASRTDEAFLAEVLAVSAEAGADRFYLVDTVGVLYPARTVQFVKALKAEGSLPLAIHAHNDFGCALANSLAAVEAGVTIVDVSVAGLGKRAGNAALEQMALALKLDFGQESGLRLESLYDTVHRVMEILGLPVPAALPLVGDGAFDFEVDSALRGSTAHTVVSGIQPELVGYRRRAGRT